MADPPDRHGGADLPGDRLRRGRPHAQPQTASNVGQTITFLLFAFTGTILPVQALPGPLPHIVPYAVPHTALIQAIRGIALTGANITHYGTQVLVGAGWLAAALVIASLAYRFTDQ